MAVTADYILKLNQQRLELIDIVNNLVDETDKLDSNATLDDAVKRLKTIDTFSILRNYIQPDIINPNSDWSIDDTEGKIVMLRDYAFCNHRGLRSVNLKSCNTVNANAFQGCTSLVQAKISGKDLTVRGNYNFNGCTALTSLSFPHLKEMGGRYMCEACSNLKSITYNKDGGSTISDSYNIFSGCTNLQAHIFPSKDEVTMVSGYYTSALNGNKAAYIYIPKCMLHIYKETWMNEFITAGRVRCIEDYDFDDERYTNNRDYLINVLGADLNDYVIEEYVEPDVRMELQKYGSNSLIATIDSRQYKKSNWGLAIVCVIKFDTYSGVLLVSQKADCVTYVGGSSTYASAGKISYNGEDYYYSARQNFMSNASAVVSDYPLLNDITNKSYTNDIDGSVEAAKDLLDYYFKKI